MKDAADDTGYTAVYRWEDSTPTDEAAAAAADCDKDARRWRQLVTYHSPVDTITIKLSESLYHIIR